jgi:quercetin dioxygenase-like cupin family protein
MIHAGDTIANPVTGERMTFLKTSRQTGGEYVLVEVAVEPNGFVASPHLHPKQSERFEVLEGELEFRLGKETMIARAGDVVVVEPGTAHRFRNTGDTVVRFTCEVRPALQFEQLLETMFALAADGKTNRKGLPNPLRLAVIAGAHFDDVRLPFPPVWMQRAGLALGAPVGRLLGFTPTYEAAAGTPATA